MTTLATFLTIRVLHMLCAALWLGGAALTTLFVVPALSDVGPDAARVMAALQRRKLMAYMPSIAGITLLSGFYLYWRLTGGFDPAISRTTVAMAYGTGGVLGLITGIGGDILVGRRMKRAATLSAQAATMAEGPQRGAVLKSAGELRQKAETAAKVVLALLVIVFILMAVGHYA